MLENNTSYYNLKKNGYIRILYISEGMYTYTYLGIYVSNFTGKSYENNEVELE